MLREFVGKTVSRIACKGDVLRIEFADGAVLLAQSDGFAAGLELFTEVTRQITSRVVERVKVEG